MSRYNTSTAGFDPLDDIDLPSYDGDDEPIAISHGEPETATSLPKPEAAQSAPPKRTAPAGPRPEATATKPQKAGGRTKKGFWADGRASMFAGIVLFMAALFALVATVGYLGSGAADQSAVTNVPLQELAANSSDISNIGGPLGALISHTLVSQTFGVAAFVIIFYLTVIGLMLLKIRFIKAGFWSLTAKCLLCTIAVSIVMGLATYDIDTHIYWGGRHGHYVNKLLMLYSGVVGAVCVSVIMVSLVLLLFLPDIQKAWGFVSAQIALRTERLRRQRAESRARAAEKASQRAMESAASQPTACNEADQAEAPAAVDEASDMTAQDQGWPSPIADAGVDAEMDQIISGAVGQPRTEPEEHYPVITEQEMLPANEADSIDSDMAPDGEETAQPEDNFTVNAATEIETARKIDSEPYDPTADLPRYHFPSIDCLIERQSKANSVDLQEQEENKERITKTLNDYGIGISHIEATVGPTVTLYEIIPAEGVRIAKIKRLEDDIALSLAALGIRIIAPIPGRGTIGIEVPNKEPQTVSMRSIITSKAYQECHMELPMAMGATISGDVFIADLTKMPHLLVAGATGMGKSVGLNAIIASLLYKKHPAELKFVMIDPKMVEFSLYSRIENHYLAKLPDEEEAIITDPAKVVTTLKSLCVEMDQRYALLKTANLRNIKEYNAKFIERRLNPEKGHRYLPYIVVIVDEFADLIMTAGKDVETPIARIAQKARAVGMHMILATQRPSTNVITGIIKANFPGRVAFRVTQMVDSRTILDRPGANQLIGRGDMLFSRDGEITRVQCAFIDTPEVDAICDEIDMQPGYEHAFYLPECLPEETEAIAVAGFGDRDPLFEEAARAVVGSGLASTSSLQRRYSIGYNRAGKIMDQMEAAGIVGPSQGGKPRQVLIDIMTLETMLSGSMS